MKLYHINRFWFLKISKAILRITKPIPGMFALIWMYFSWWVQIWKGNKMLKFWYFWTILEFCRVISVMFMRNIPSYKMATISLQSVVTYLVGFHSKNICWNNKLFSLITKSLSKTGFLQKLQDLKRYCNFDYFIINVSPEICHNLQLQSTAITSFLPDLKKKSHGGINTNCYGVFRRGRYKTGVETSLCQICPATTKRSKGHFWRKWFFYEIEMPALFRF